LRFCLSQQLAEGFPFCCEILFYVSFDDVLDCVLNFVFDHLFYFALPLRQCVVFVVGVLDFAEAAIEHVFDEAVVLCVVALQEGAYVLSFGEVVGGGVGVAVEGVFVVVGRDGGDRFGYPFAVAAVV
jgi:hypothetical protein